MKLIACLPIDIAAEGRVFDRQQVCDKNDRVFFQEWEAPLVWHHQSSYIVVDRKFNGQKALHFAFEERTPEAVWSKGWHIWYDNTLIFRQKLPSDCIFEATIALEEQTCGLGGDNMDYIRPWAGIVTRMQDLRRYYFLTLEFPDRVVLYRRDDKQWVVVAYRQIKIDVWTPYKLKLECNGNNFEAWLDDTFLFRATDYSYISGWGGIRATCTSFFLNFTINIMGDSFPFSGSMNRLPQPEVVADFDISEYGKLSTKGKKAPPGVNDERYNANIITFDNFFIAKVYGKDTSWICMDYSGKLRWILSLSDVDDMVVLENMLVGIGKENLYLIDSVKGTVIKKVSSPHTPDGKPINSGNSPARTADFDGKGYKHIFFLSCGADDRNLWAYDSELNQRWYIEAPSGGGHGHHLSVCDVDRDGRDEIFFGCALWNYKGENLWIQKEVIDRLKCPNGKHVDSTVMGFFNGMDTAPTVHMAASSAGHIVADALTGRIIAVHPQGHVQCCTSGRVIPGLQSEQVIATNRWGSYGVTAIYSGDGRRLSRFQPGFICQEVKPIWWGNSDFQYLLVVDGQGWRGIYDYQGERLIDIDPLVPYTDRFVQRYDRVQAWVLKDGILLRIGNRLRVIAPE